MKNVKAAAFDTRIPLSDVNSAPLKLLIKLFGYAAEPIAEKLEKKRGNTCSPSRGISGSRFRRTLERGGNSEGPRMGQKTGKQMNYYHVDVFSSEPMSGNGLTVVFPDKNLEYETPSDDYQGIQTV